MLDKSLIKARRPYEDRLEIITLCERLKSFYDKYKGTCKNIVAGGETVWFDTPEYQRDLVWTLVQKREYIINLFNGMAEIKPTILLYYEDKKDIYEVLDGKQRLTTLFQNGINSLRDIDKELLDMVVFKYDYEIKMSDLAVRAFYNIIVIEVE